MRRVHTQKTQTERDQLQVPSFKKKTQLGNVFVQSVGARVHDLLLKLY